MAGYGRDKGNTASLIAVGAVILLAVAAVVIFIVINAGKGGEAAAPIETAATPDAAAKNGMVGGETYSGEKNPEGILSYRINGQITVKDGEGRFLIENQPKNTCLMVVRFYNGEELIYESGYIFPNQYIETDRLDSVPEPGEYRIRAVFEGVDPVTLESRGVSETELELIVE